MFRRPMGRRRYPRRMTEEPPTGVVAVADLIAVDLLRRGYHVDTYPGAGGRVVVVAHTAEHDHEGCVAVTVAPLVPDS